METSAPAPHLVSVVVPVYQGERTVATVVEELSASVSGRLSPQGRPYRVTGLAQGKFEVSGARARPDLSETAFVPRAALRAGERRVETMALDELERRVRSAR